MPLHRLGILAALGALLPAQGFVGSYAAAERTPADDPAARRLAFEHALQAFLLLDSAERAMALAQGARCAWEVEHFTLAADLYEQVFAAGVGDATVAEQGLRALQRAGRGQQLLRRAHALTTEFPAAVQRVLITERGLDQVRGYELADRWLRRGETELGLWVFRYRAEAGGEDPIALANWALALRHVGAEAECEAVYQRALAKAPKDAVLWNDYGLFLKGAGRWPDAARAFMTSRGLEESPRSGPATASLVLVGQRTGQQLLADPAQALAEVVEQRPDALLARRVYLDVLCGGRAAKPFASSAPDTGAPRR